MGPLVLTGSLCLPFAGLNTPKHRKKTDSRYVTDFLLHNHFWKIDEDDTIRAVCVQDHPQQQEDRKTSCGESCLADFHTNKKTQRHHTNNIRLVGCFFFKRILESHPQTFLLELAAWDNSSNVSKVVRTWEMLAIQEGCIGVKFTCPRLQALAVLDSDTSPSVWIIAGILQP